MGREVTSRAQPSPPPFTYLAFHPPLIDLKLSNFLPQVLMQKSKVGGGSSREVTRYNGNETDVDPSVVDFHRSSRTYQFYYSVNKAF